MAEPDDDRGDAAPRDREQHQPPAMPARRQVKRAQEHRERRRRAADMGARAGRVEAERPGAARHELVLAQQLGAAGIQVSAQPERYRDRLKDRNQQEQQRQDDRKADAKRIAALATADGQRRDANRDGDHQADHAGAVDPPDGQRRPGDGSDQQDDAGGPARSARRASSGSGATPMNDARRWMAGRIRRSIAALTRRRGPAPVPSQKTRSSTTRTSPGRTLTFCERPSVMSATG